MCSPNEFAGDRVTQRANCTGCGRCGKRDGSHGTTDGYVKGVTDGSGTDAASSRDVCQDHGAVTRGNGQIVERFS